MTRSKTKGKIHLDGKQRLQVEKEKNLIVERDWVEKVKSNRGPAGWIYLCIKGCGRKFKTRIVAVSHAKICGERGARAKGRKKSLRKKSCSICGHEELTKRKLTLHRKKHHGSLLGRHRHRCSRCHHQFSSMWSYRRHLALHTRTEVYLCPEVDCGKKFSNKANVTRHRKSAHNLLGGQWYNLLSGPNSSPRQEDVLLTLRQSSPPNSPPEEFLPTLASFAFAKPTRAFTESENEQVKITS